MKAITPFNKTDIFQTQVIPLLDRIRDICHKNQIPYYFTAAVQSTNKDTEYFQAGETAPPMGLEVKQDLIVEHIKIGTGNCEVIIADHIPDIEV